MPAMLFSANLPTITLDFDKKCKNTRRRWSGSPLDRRPIDGLQALTRNRFFVLDGGWRLTWRNLPCWTQDGANSEFCSIFRPGVKPRLAVLRRSCCEIFDKALKSGGHAFPGEDEDMQKNWTFKNSAR